MIELSIAALVAVWLVSSVHLPNLELFKPLQVVCSHEPGERHCEVITKREELPALICEIVHELIGLAILAHKNLASLEDWCVDLLSPMALEDLLDLLKSFLFDRHLTGQHVAGSLSYLSH